MGTQRRKTAKAKRKLTSLALAKSVRKRLPPPSRPFKDKRGKPGQRDWGEEEDLG